MTVTQTGDTPEYIKHYWKYDFFEARTKKRRIARKKYKQRLIHMGMVDYGADLRKWTFPQIMRFASLSSARFDHAPTKQELEQGLYDAKVKGMTL